MKKHKKMIKVLNKRKQIYSKSSMKGGVGVSKLE